MNLAVKKIELIEWLVGIQDEKIISEIATLKEDTVKIAFKKQMPKTLKDLQNKIDRSEKDIKADRTYKHEDVESFFKAKFRK